MAAKKAAKKTADAPKEAPKAAEAASVEPLTSENVKGNVYRADMGESLPPQKPAGVE